MAMDEDLPPTTSLRDDTPSRTLPSPLPSQSSSSAQLPLPPSLIPNSETTTLHVFGPPPDQLPNLESYLGQIGPITSYRPGPEGSNWWVVEFGTATAASYALRRHGEIINGRWMLGLKVAGPGSTLGCTLGEGVEDPVGMIRAGGGGGGGGGGAGTPMRVMQNAAIIRQKPVVQQSRGEDYAWDDQEKADGFTNRVAQWLVSPEIRYNMICTSLMGTTSLGSRSKMMHVMCTRIWRIMQIMSVALGSRQGQCIACGAVRMGTACYAWKMRSMRGWGLEALECSSRVESEKGECFFDRSVTMRVIRLTPRRQVGPTVLRPRSGRDWLAGRYGILAFGAVPDARTGTAVVRRSLARPRRRMRYCWGYERLDIRVELAGAHREGPAIRLVFPKRVELEHGSVRYSLSAQAGGHRTTVDQHTVRVQ